MNSYDFVTEGLRKIQLQFPNTTIQYQFSPLRGEHMVQVDPVEILDENDEFAEMEMNLTMEFIEQYSDEGLMFVSEDSLVQVTNPDLVLFPLIDIQQKHEKIHLQSKFFCECSDAAYAGEDNYSIAA